MKNIHMPKMILKIMVWIFLPLAIFQSCKKNIDTPQGTVTATPTLSISSNTVVLQRADTAKPALSFSWTAAKVEGLTGNIVYILEIDKKGNNFSNAAQIRLGGDTLELPVTVKRLNKLLGFLPVNTPNELETRVVTAVS